MLLSTLFSNTVVFIGLLAQSCYSTKTFRDWSEGEYERYLEPYFSPYENDYAHDYYPSSYYGSDVRGRYFGETAQYGRRFHHYYDTSYYDPGYIPGKVELRNRLHRRGKNSNKGKNKPGGSSKVAGVKKSKPRKLRTAPELPPRAPPNVEWQHVAGGSGASSEGNAFSVTTHQPDMWSTQPAALEAMKNLVQQKAPPGASRAKIYGTPHKSDSDSTNHITVHYSGYAKDGKEYTIPTGPHENKPEGYDRHHISGPEVDNLLNAAHT